LAELIAGGGGPAVLTVAGVDRQNLTEYFTHLYAGILHNDLLTEAARPISESVEVSLIYGNGGYKGTNGNELLRFDKWMDELNWGLRNYAETMSEYLAKMRSIASSLHKTQKTSLTPLIQKFQDLSWTIGRNQQSLEQIRTLRWGHEYEGVLPLLQVADSYGRIVEEAGKVGGEGFHLLDYDPLIEQAKAAARRAPRVLNAGFADPKTERVLRANEPLIADSFYDLLVDVGPRWNKIPSLVKGNAEFPEEALDEPSRDGYEIQVMFVSQDFNVKTDTREGPDYAPGLESLRMFVPARTGRSFPLKKGEERNRQGPVVFRVQTPSLKAGRTTAHGRLCLYYQNNLIQSASVNMTVVGKQKLRRSIEVENEIVVDFRLTGAFQNIESFQQREMILDPSKERRWAAEAFEPVYQSSPENRIQTKYDVGLNITVNDDHSGEHRILVKNLSDLSPAWKSYNVSAMTTILDDARTYLEGCFWKKDAHCDVFVDAEGQKHDALNSKLGKDLDQFKCDIFKLATFGEKLFNTIFHDLQGSGLEKAQWVRKLSKALDTKTIIQVARTGQAQYVFPWALVYDIPLPDWNKLRFCNVLEKEWKGGVRDQEPKPRCLEHDADAKNVLCPYGFWGLKHYIEQPIPPLTNLIGDYELLENMPTTINAGEALEVALGVTRDKTLSAVTIDEHLAELLHVFNIKTFVPPGGADNWTAVCDMLKSPDVVYFLCHGETDGRDSYLGIGLRDQRVEHRVYSTNLYSWARTQNLEFWETWQNNHPLVFINGCHTFGLKPSDLLTFVSTFADLGASGVIGTEISVRLPVAVEIAQMVFEGLAKTNMTICDVMYQVRWKLASKGSLLGLAYTPYCMANLHLVANN
jgi:hypothetical protein